MNTLTVPVHDDDHVQGSPDAQVTLIEYGDYECPYCGEAYPIVKRLAKKMGPDMQFVFRNFPLTESHPRALAAAQAAEAAGLQDRFWEMHDLLYENQATLEDEDLIAFARRLKLDIKTFTRDFASNAVRTKIEEDFSGGVRSGVNGTPTFFINGVRHDGSFDYEDLLDALQEQLESRRDHESHTRSQRQNTKERRMTHAKNKR